jgi:hypothetical protein
MVALMGAKPAWSQKTAPEYDLKAAYIFNFSLFVDWPAGAFEHPDSPIIIGVLGDSRFATVLQETLKGQDARGRSFVVQSWNSAKNVQHCHLLFVASGAAQEWAQVVQSVRRTPTLTIGEWPDFIGTGGIVNFFVEGKKIRFDISAETARRAGLNMSSKMLGLARSTQ